MQKALIVLMILLSVLAGGWLGRRLLVDRSEPVACTMEAKLCADGSFVSRTAPDCDFSPCPKEDLIQLESPAANEAVSSPLTVKGKARGFWFFEADFPVKLIDADGNLLAQAVARAGGEWMTEEFVPFEAVLNFQAPVVNQGFLILEKDNPSGLAENAAELRVPVFFAAEKARTRPITLFYYNPENDKDAAGNLMCGRNGLAPVAREIPLTATPIQDAVSLLLSGGLTVAEREQGIGTEFPLAGLSLKGAALNSGILTLEFDDPQNKTVGGSCRVGVLWAQIEATVKQFSEVQQVRFLPEEVFQP